MFHFYIVFASVASPGSPRHFLLFYEYSKNSIGEDAKETCPYSVINALRNVYIILEHFKDSHFWNQSTAMLSESQLH